MAYPILTLADLEGAVADWLNRSDLTPQIPAFIQLCETAIQRDQDWFHETYSTANGGSPLLVTANPFQLPDYVRRVKSMKANTGAFSHPLTLVTDADMASRQSSNRNASGIPIIFHVETQMATWMQSGAGVGPWVEFWPSPMGSTPGGGATASCTVANGVVTGVSLLTGGTGYDPSNPPSVAFIGGYPTTTATATVTIAGGAITSVTLSNGGAGYQQTPTVGFGSFAIDLKYVRKLPSILTAPNTNVLFALYPDVYLYGSLIHSAPFLKEDDRVQTWKGFYDQIIKDINKDRERGEYSANPKRARPPVVFG